MERSNRAGKHEIRSTKSETNLKDQGPKLFDHSCFVLVSDFVLRISDFLERSLPMRGLTSCLGCVSICGLLLAGCGDSVDEKPKPPVVDQSKSDGKNGNAKEKKQTPNDPKPPKPKPEIAKVVLTAQEAATSPVKVGDAFPDAKLKDAAGSELTLSQLRGKLATVIVLGTSQGPRARAKSVQAFKMLAAAAAEMGPDVKCVAISVSGDAAMFKQMADELQLPFPLLLDADAALSKQLVNAPPDDELGSQLPRVYLLDAQGKLLWFSLDYSDAAQRELLSGVEFLKL
jgi:peroxiredoxin